MKFIDEAIIYAVAGKGGAGSRHFRREKFVPLGGPDGGDGGQGGSVILKADASKQTLVDFVFRPNWEAESGEAGGGSNKHGKSGNDLEILVPPGTQVYRADSTALLADLTENGQVFVLAKGGRGGKGNTFFKSSTNQAPDYTQPGEEGGSGNFRLSLKVIADIGLVGFPNAGKSTLISRISAARPKIADYPFTTLEPNLGVARAKDGRSFVVADIPGLIPGAHLGKGLGIKFLKHIERTRLLVHLIDPLQLQENGNILAPLDSFQAINEEIRNFSEELFGKPRLVVLSKCDTIQQEERLKLAAQLESTGFQVLTISSVTGEGLEDLLLTFSRKLLEINQEN